MSISFLVACHACKQYKDTWRIPSHAGVSAILDELVPPVCDRERWWYKLTQTSRPPYTCKRRDGKSPEYTFSIGARHSKQLDCLIQVVERKRKKTSVDDGFGRDRTKI